MRITVRVPATSANLGPGFDSLGLALDLCNEVTIDTDEPPRVSWEGEGATELPTDGSDMISRAIAWVVDEGGHPVPPHALHGSNRIPLERGLGSSAAACVAGVAAARLMLGMGLDRAAMLRAADAIEGHPDNAAAAINGGLTLAYRGRNGASDAVRLEPHPDLRPAALVPTDVRIPTSRARASLPEHVPFADAAFNAGRAALAVVALSERPELLGPALEDRLHQAKRLELAPEVASTFERVRAAGLPVCVSGSGPTLLAFEARGRRVPELGSGWRVIRLAPRGMGTDVVDR
jgi:homoserine kinase